MAIFNSYVSLPDGRPWSYVHQLSDFVNGGLMACINFMDFPESDATGSPTTGSSTASPGPVIHGVQPGKCHGQTTLKHIESVCGCLNHGMYHRNIPLKHH